MPGEVIASQALQAALTDIGFRGSGVWGFGGLGFRDTIGIMEKETILYIGVI